jgi:hypothetical protein
MALEDIQKFELITKSGLFDCIIMPFGMKNATNILSKTIIEVFGKYLNKFLKVFLDNLNIHNHNWEHFCFVLLKLKEVNLKFNIRKCEFAKFDLTFLRHVVNCDGIQPNLWKIKATTNFLIPTTITNVRAFLGLTCYYQN